MDPNDTVHAACLVVLIFETIAGIIIDVFTLLIIIIDVLKGKNLSPTDKILMALSISILFYAVMIPGNFYQRPDPYVSYVLFTLTVYSVTSCCWLTAGLCFFYFIKIIHFTSGFLSWFKLKIDSTVPWLIMVVEVLSLSGSLFSLLAYHISQDYLSSTNTSMILSNSTMPRTYLTRFTTYNIVLFSNVLPFLIMTITILGNVGFLRLHVSKTRTNKETCVRANLKSHQNAAKAMTRLLLFYLIFYLDVFGFLFQIIPQTPVLYNLHLIVIFAYSPGHLVLLIFANSKMKKAWQQIWALLACPNV